MAIKPSFLTGAVARVKAGNITLAYCQDVSYTVEVTTIPVEAMGRFEVISNEPIATFVSGSLSVIRYTQVAKDNNMPDVAAGGNGIGKWNHGVGRNASEHINPRDILVSETFDIEIYQKNDPTNAPVLKLLDCRLTRKSGGVNKRGILVETFNFVGIMAQDDSYTAARSSNVQDLS